MTFTIILYDIYIIFHIANISEFNSLIILYSFSQNHIVERMWVEINKRVNYPLKKALVEMHSSSLIMVEDPADPIHCFCVSWVSLKVANVGTSLTMQSWNAHPIPGKTIINISSLH